MQKTVVSDPTRLGRSLKEYLSFLEECAGHDVLLVFDGKLCNVGDNHGLFTSRLLALVGEYESAARQDHIRRGITAKVSAGRAVTAAPAGYLSFADGSWDLDPDPAVQAAISSVFRAFLEERSCARTVRKLKELSITLPRCPPGRPLRWIEPNVRVVRQIIRNRRYSGDYLYREQVTDRGRGPRGQLRVRPGSVQPTSRGSSNRRSWKFYGYTPRPRSAGSLGPGLHSCRGSSAALVIEQCL